MFKKKLFTLFLVLGIYQPWIWCNEIPDPTIPLSREKSTKWVANNYARMQKETNGPNIAQVKTVFIGDSITNHWRKAGGTYWNKSFSKALNFGVGGDRTEHVLYRLQSKQEEGLGLFDNPEFQPENIILMIGTNNLFKHDASQMVDGIKAVVKRLQELRPKARIVLCSILPAANKNFNTDKIIPTNKAIQSLEGVNFLNLYPVFTLEDRKTYKKSLYVDGLHLNSEGYKVWHELLIKKLTNQ